MLPLIFVLFLFGALFTYYMGYKEQNLFFQLLSIGFCIGLFGGLQVSGIDYLTQITSSGNLVYASYTGANNPFIKGISYLFFGMGLLCVYHVFRNLERNHWQIPL